MLIADEGPGLAADTQEKIFDRFYTDRSDQPLENSQSVAGFGHSGLGLSISRQIARARMVAIDCGEQTRWHRRLFYPEPAFSRDTVQAETR